MLMSELYCNLQVLATDGMYFWFAGLGAGCYKRIWQRHRENKAWAFCASFPPLCHLLTALMGCGALTVLLHFKASFTVWPEDACDLCFLLPPLVCRPSSHRVFRRHTIRHAQLLKGSLSTQPYFQIQETEALHKYQLCSFLQSQIQGKVLRMSPDNPRGWFYHTLWLGNWVENIQI